MINKKISFGVQFNMNLFVYTFIIRRALWHKNKITNLSVWTIRLTWIYVQITHNKTCTDINTYKGVKVIYLSANNLLKIWMKQQDEWINSKTKFISNFYCFCDYVTTVNIHYRTFAVGAVDAIWNITLKHLARPDFTSDFTSYWTLKPNIWNSRECNNKYF